jgi:hypothetical protein
MMMKFVREPEMTMNACLLLHNLLTCRDQGQIDPARRERVVAALSDAGGDVMLLAVVAIKARQLTEGILAAVEPAEEFFNLPF